MPSKNYKILCYNEIVYIIPFALPLFTFVAVKMFKLLFFIRGYSFLYYGLVEVTILNMLLA